MDLGLSVIGVASPIPGTGQAIKAARGGINAVNKGKEGVRLARKLFEEKGYTHVADEVTVVTKNGKTRFDMIMRDLDQNLCGIECKNGATTKLTRNQKRNHLEVNSGDGGVAIGENARRRGIDEEITSAITVRLSPTSGQPTRIK